MKKALVIGGAGFIGSHLCESLLEQDYHVTAVDNFVTGQKQNISHIKSSNFQFLEHDITHPLPFNETFEEIYNLASPASPSDFSTMPIFILKTTALGHMNCLEYAKANGGKVLFASTSEIYGDPSVHPQPESYFGNVNTLGPRACYDEAKRFGEALTLAYRREHKIETRLIRIFNTYGPRMRLDDGRIIPNFFTQGLKNEAITVYGDGNQTRSFCYVNDLVDGIISVMNSDDHMPFNLGDQNEHTVLEMAMIIKELTGNTKEVIFHPLPEDDPKRRRPDTSKAQSTLNWSPKVSLDEGLSRSLKFFKDALSK